MTLSLDTAYRSFGGEVEASSTPTICRLADSRRHQLSAIALADLALANGLPSCHGFKETVAAGGLISLGPDLMALARQGASLVDKIIKGARPADLPVEQPTRYVTSINLRTAKALGLSISQALLASADEVIE